MNQQIPTHGKSGQSDVPISKADYEVLAAFRYALRQFLHASEQRAQAVGLTNQQFLTLLAIKGFPGRDYVTMGELAERLQIRHHSAVGLVDRLTALGAVVRQPAPADRRQVYVMLTPRGEEMLEKLVQANRRQLRHIEPQLNLLLELLTADADSQVPAAEAKPVFWEHTPPPAPSEG
ncbi:MAG TPA: MarR family winged helix-turn-helix transcriptional regulator [Chthonomonadaceae bacterium]|nr:MarR family winged helix-turn-helix transcriptional regulator [Chthonomonadaceae bacterium]